MSKILELRTNNGNYIWKPGLEIGKPDTLLNRPLKTSAFMPEIKGGSKVMAFGDYSYYWVADRQNRTFRRLNELYARTDQVGFLTTQRVDGKLILPEAVQQKLAESLVQKYGDDVVFVNKVVINDMNFEDAYNEAIQQKSIAQQNADKQKIENEAAIAKAEADKQVAITNAEAEAQKTSIAAEAQAEANRKLAESLCDMLIEYQKIQKWDGKLPTVSGGNALVSIDPAE